MIKLLTKMFFPKKANANDNWMVSLERVGAEADYDLNLLIEQLQGTKHSYLLELRVNPDNTLEIQVTSEQGNFIIHGGPAAHPIASPIASYS